MNTSSSLLEEWRPCYRKQLFLQLATQQLQEKFTCNTPFCNCNCSVVSCKKSRTTLYFSQHCETSCLCVTSPQQLARQVCQNGPIRAHLLQDAGDLVRPPSCLLFNICIATCTKSCKHVTPLLQLERFFICHHCVASWEKLLRVTWPWVWLFWTASG